MTVDEKETIEFANKNAEEAIRRYFEVKAERDNLVKKLEESDSTKRIEIEAAKKEMARTIFKEMYEVVRDAVDETIIVTTEDVKRVARRYGVLVTLGR